MNDDKFDIENSKCEDFVYSFQNVIDFRNSFKNKFKYIVAYHGTNLSNEELNSVNKNGLKLASKDLIIKKAKHRFVENNNVNSNKEIENDIIQYFTENELHTKNEINFGLVKSDLIENYHYLLFGSESLLPLADYLKSKYYKSFRKILVESGLHYILEVLIPVEKTEDIWIDIIYDYFHESTFAISIVHYYNLPIENIVKIEKVERPIDTQKLMII